MQINSIIRSYISFCLHPFRTHQELATTRVNPITHVEDDSVLSLFPVESLKESTSDEKLSFYDILSVSWFFAILRAFYSVLGIHLGFMGYEAVADAKGVFWFAQSFSFEKLLLGLGLVEVLFFPLGCWVFAKLWSAVIQFFVQLFGIDNSEENLPVLANEIASYALTSRLFYVFPLFGKWMASIVGMLYLYAGLRNRLGMSAIQGIIVLVSPLILLFFFLSIFVVYIWMIVAAF